MNYIFDCVTWIFCLRLLKVYKKIHKFMDVLNYFATQEWVFTNDRLHALMAKLTFKDREYFYCDIRDVDWNVYFETYILGIRIYLLKDPLDTLQQARDKWQKYDIFSINLSNLNLFIHILVL